MGRQTYQALLAAAVGPDNNGQDIEGDGLSATPLACSQGGTVLRQGHEQTAWCLS